MSSEINIWWINRDLQSQHACMGKLSIMTYFSPSRTVNFLPTLPRVRENKGRQTSFILTHTQAATHTQRLACDRDKQVNLTY